MKRIEDFQDVVNRTVTYELSNGRRVRLSVDDVREYGAVNLLQHMGEAINTARVPVHQHGKMIGTVPGDFDPMFIKSTSFFYDVRAGDFQRHHTYWEASKTLCPGDLEAVPGFIWHRPSPTSEK